MQHILNIYDLESIKEKRNLISNELLNQSLNIRDNYIKMISDKDLSILMKLYDRHFLENWFSINYKNSLIFSISKRMTRSAGKTIYTRKNNNSKSETIQLEIRISADFLYNYSALKGDKTVCGLKTCNSLEALLIIFEHELCHVIEFLVYGKSNCSGTKFKNIAYNMFGHNESHHELPTVKTIVETTYKLNIGTKVNFTFEGHTFNGIIYRINKRATVMVADASGTYRDNNGTHYTKYYVPYDKLMPIT
jgi:hypothetical protein